MKALFRFLKRSGLGRIPGLLALYNFLYPIFIGFNKTSPIIKVDGHKVFIDRKDLSISRRLLVYGEITEDTDQYLKNSINKGMVVADIGANIGYYTLIAADRVGPNGHVYAFEPDPRCLKILNKNVFLNNYSNVDIIPKALSNNGETISVCLDKTHYCLTSFAKDNLNSFQEKVDVDTVSLDNFFEKLVEKNRLDFIKINIQGMEGLVIDGARGLLQKNNITMVCEFWPEGLQQCGTNPAELLQIVRNLGYGWKPIFDNSEKNYSIDETIQLGNMLPLKRKKALHLVVTKN